jgi:isopenicillin N synthase-like dioxygenase
MDVTAIPEIDIAPFRRGDAAAGRTIAHAIDAACTDIGFFTVTGHGVPAELIAETRAQAAAFFALPVEEKMKVQRPPQKISRGYNWLGDRSLAYSLGVSAPPDIQEAFAFGPEVASDRAWRDGEVAAAMLAKNIWPDRPAGFRATMIAYYAAMSDVGRTMLRLMAAALDVPEAVFAGKFEREASVARLIRYPALAAPPQPGQLRAGVHTDYGTMTFVRGDDTPGGLQVKARHGGWIDVHPSPASFVCNIGDALMRWTNDRWVSTLHRVAVPPDDSGAPDRISLVFFQLPDHDAEIRCIESCRGAGEKYPPVTFAEHYLGKVMKAAHARLDAGVGDAAAG